MDGGAHVLTIRVFGQKTRQNPTDTKAPRYNRTTAKLKISRLFAKNLSCPPSGISPVQHSKCLEEQEREEGRNFDSGQRRDCNLTL